MAYTLYNMQNSQLVHKELHSESCGTRMSDDDKIPLEIPDWKSMKFVLAGLVMTPRNISSTLQKENKENTKKIYG